MLSLLCLTGAPAPVRKTPKTSARRDETDFVSLTICTKTYQMTLYQSDMVVIDEVGDEDY